MTEDKRMLEKREERRETREGTPVCCSEPLLGFLLSSLFSLRSVPRRIVHDPRRHEDDQVLPMFRVRGEREQVANEGKRREERNALPVLRDGGHGESGEHR